MSTIRSSATFPSAGAPKAPHSDNTLCHHWLTGKSCLVFNGDLVAIRSIRTQNFTYLGPEMIMFSAAICPFSGSCELPQWRGLRGPWNDGTQSHNHLRMDSRNNYEQSARLCGFCDPHPRSTPERFAIHPFTLRPMCLRVSCGGVRRTECSGDCRY